MHFLFSLCVLCPTCITLLDLITLIIYGEVYKIQNQANLAEADLYSGGACFASCPGQTDFSASPQPHQANARIVPHISLQLLPSTFSLIHH
jgi:hypothetical protein